MTDEAGFSPSGRQAYLWSLVLDAAGIPHVLVRQAGGWQLLVADSHLGPAREEIACFEEENRDWPPPKPSLDARAAERQPPTVLLVGLLFLFYTVTGPWSGHNPWFAHGAIDSGRILDNGEWWRLVTALTLHAGPVHLAGNLVIGGILVHYLAKMVGTGLGWCLLVGLGAGGNLLNILWRAGNHHAVGFSTAVFVAVGLLSGLRLSRSLRDLVLPLGAGAGLLALLGTGGEETDLGAHFWGMGIGLAGGILLRLLPAGLRRRLEAPAWQWSFFGVAAVIVWDAWHRALTG